MVAREPPRDRTIHIRVSVTRVAPGILLPGAPGSSSLRPLPPEAGAAAAEDIGLFGRVDGLRAQLVDGPGGYLVLARRLPGVPGVVGRLPAPLPGGRLRVCGVEPGAPEREVPVVGGGADRYWEGAGRPRAETEYRRAVRTRTGRNLLFEEVNATEHPRVAPPEPTGLELSGEAFEALDLEGDLAWVVWQPVEAPTS
jgi:hypothetical protein